jgi:mitogen-activated protein kinase kinase kinase
LKIVDGNKPSLPSEIILKPEAEDFLYQKCLASDPAGRPTARELLDDAFIKDVDPKWTFSESKIGMMVAQRGAKSIRE